MGDEITAEMEVTEKKADARHVVIRYRLADQQGREVLVGEMVVEPPDRLRPIIAHTYESF